MEITVSVGGGGPRDVELVLDSAGAAPTLADVVAALAAPHDHVVLVDGQTVDAELGLDEAGLVNGSVLEIVAGLSTGAPTGGRAGDDSTPTCEIAVVGGPWAGRSVAFTDGTVVVGRSRRCEVRLADPTVCARHARITRLGATTTVEDLGSHNGTRIDGIAVTGRVEVHDGALIEVGATELTIRVRLGDDRPAQDPRRTARHGVISFNRPPRGAQPPAVDAVSLPDPPGAPGRRPALGVSALVVPMLLAVVMVKVMGDIRFALFALLSPLMLVTNHVAARRRNIRESRTSRRRFEQELQGLQTALAAAVDAERHRRELLMPDLAELVRRAVAPSTRLWERRAGDADHMLLRLGRGPVTWPSPVDQARIVGPELEAAVRAASRIARCPVSVDLARGGVVGLVGDRPMAVALARSLLVQACVLHGPADLAVMVLAQGDQAGDWEWTKWLQHTRAGDGVHRYLSSDTGASHRLMDAVLAGAPARPAALGGGTGAVAGAGVLLLVDDPALTTGRHAPTRAVLRGEAGPVCGIVIAPTSDRLPASCDTVVALVDDLGAAEVVRPQRGERITDVVIAGIDDSTARRCALRLARFDDPEVASRGSLPPEATLISLLGWTDPAADAGAVAARWAAAGPDPSPVACIGVGEAGVVELDLVADGPHGLVGGTTGSGKSELLRSAVAAMAVRSSPQHLVFVLVDYKGGSAFDACARLPHVVGIVTDLDAHLGERALQSLEAELRRRESQLRSCAAPDLGAYRAAGSPAGAMPRLVLVVDEFATLASELPDFMGALVGVAQRGRSLGVHMLLATQRPSGAVNANIKANTNIRIALRMQDVADSHDVIDHPDAAHIPRTAPGRAFVRFGHGEVTPIQTALASTLTPAGAGPIVVRSFRFGPGSRIAAAPVSPGGPSDLTRIVDACVAAFAATGSAPPRRPWLEMLPTHIDHNELEGLDLPPGVVPVGLADDPASQSRRPSVWDPAGGHLALFGALGSGTTTAAVTTVVAAATRWSPDALHVYAVDFGGGGLSDLAALAHTGAMVGANEHERQVRLIRFLGDDIARRRALAASAREGEPRIVLVIDGLAAFLADHDGLDGAEMSEGLRRILAEGPGVGVAAVLTADRAQAVPMRMLGSVSRRLLFRHADPGDFATIGVRVRDLPAFVPGRAIDAESGLVVQVGVLDVIERTGRLRARHAGVTERPPRAIEALPVAVAMAGLAVDAAGGTAADAAVSGGPLVLPLGVAADDHRVCSVALHPGDHLLVAGQPRSGVSTTLRVVTRLVDQACPGVVLVGIAPERSPLRREHGRFDALGTVDELEKVIELALVDAAREWIVVVDDAHRIDDGPGLERLAGVAHCRLVVGGRSDHLHAQFGHWTRRVRRGGAGLLLQPRLEADGDLLGVRLPRRLAVPLVPGRGFLVVDGDPVLMQVAGADVAAEPAA